MKFSRWIKRQSKFWSDYHFYRNSMNHSRLQAFHKAGRTL